MGQPNEVMPQSLCSFRDRVPGLASRLAGSVAENVVARGTRLIEIIWEIVPAELVTNRESIPGVPGPPSPRPPAAVVPSTVPVIVRSGRPADAVAGEMLVKGGTGQPRTPHPV